MKLSIKIISFLLFFSCSLTQKLNYKLLDDGFNKIYVGEINKKILSDDTLNIWFAQNYKNYVPDKNIIEKINSNKDGLNFIVFAGTWCGDTKRELPKFYKIVNEAGISEKNIQLFCVDRQKKSLDTLTNLYDLKKVPTIIIFKNGNEIGRFVERSELGIEKEIEKIILSEK